MPEIAYDREAILPDAQDQFDLCEENLLIRQHQIPAFELAKKRGGLFDALRSVKIETS